MPKVMLNGRCIDENEAHLPIDDRGFLYGESVFTTLRLYGGYPMELERHVQRINATLKLPLFSGVAALDAKSLYHEIEKLREANGLSEGILRVRITSGRGAGILPPERGGESRLLTLTPLPELEPLQQQGVRLHLSTLCRSRENPLTRHKLGSYAENVLLKQESTAAGFDDGIFCDEAGNLLETSTGNLFAVINGILVTPDLTEPILPGITRELLLERARAIGIPTLVGPLSLEGAQQAEEMFVTNAVSEVVPVSRLGDKTFALVPGPVTFKLSEQYRQLANARRLAELYTGTPANEQRCAPRHQVIRETEVLDAESGKSLGQLMNLSEEGLLVVGPEELNPPRDFHLQFELPAGKGSAGKVELEARCVRTLEVGVGLYGAGFRFLNPGSSAREDIQQAIGILCSSA